jgi:hypothetical protein
MTLKDRCRTFLIEALKSKASCQVIDIVDDLEAFVVAETGRAAGGDKLDKSLPLCLYFKDAEDREAFIAAVMQFQPNLVAKRLP